MYIGMKDLVAAVVSSYTRGSAITYDTGFSVGPAFAANISFVINDNPDFGDDVEIANDNGINGYNGTVDASDMEQSVMAALLGWDSSGTTAIEYTGTSDMPPEVGFGYLRVRQKPHSTTPYYEGWWFKRAQFSMQNHTANTKKRQIEWGHPQLGVNGLGSETDNTGKVRWFETETFSSYADALTWLRTKANISTQTQQSSTP